MGSFLSGEDRLSWGFGLRHRPDEFREVFVDGRLEHSKQKGREGQLEFSLLTGARLVWDTRVVRWDPSMRIEGIVFHDLSGDGQLQPGEEGLEGVKVIAAEHREAVTTHGGRFIFPNVFGKAIPVQLDVGSLPKGYIVTTPQLRTVRPGSKPPGLLLFGALGRSELRGRVFYDIDGNKLEVTAWPLEDGVANSQKMIYDPKTKQWNTY